MKRYDRLKSTVARPRPCGMEPLEGRVLFATVPTGFADTSNWASGLGNNATAMAFAPDGRLFVSQQDGRLRVIKDTGLTTAQLLSTPFLTKTVDSSGERGLLGVAFDPAFLSNGYVYVYYTVPGAGVHNRISRFTAVDADPDLTRYVPGDTAEANSELVLMDLDPLSSATNHNGGALHFGADGKLYATVGENANPANAQTLNNRLGKVLRINPDGSIPTDNPFYSTASGANRAIYAMGLRNPFTFAFQPGTGRLFINDVGQSAWEEIDEGRAGANYGWPATEGAFNPAQFPNYTNPLYTYANDVSTCAITGGTFYNPATGRQDFPSRFVGDYFFADNCAGWIKVMDTGGATPQVSTFATGINGPTDLAVGPDGALYYLARFVGRVGRIASTEDLRPTVSDPSSNVVPEGSPAAFRVSVGGDEPRTIQWQRLSPGTSEFVDIPGATSSTYTLPQATMADNGAVFRVVVSNNFGSATSREATLTVQPAVPPSVVGRYVFYNYSAFDGGDSGSNAADDAAIATDKQALLPGQKATFANVTSYAPGINGIMVDVADLAAAETITADNFIFSTSRGDGNWTPGPAPDNVSLRRGDGAGGTARVTVTWPDSSIADRWLQVTFNPTGPSSGGPANADIFYFGNLRAETGDAPLSTNALRVTALDIASVRRGYPASGVPVTNRFDFDRDGRVNALDLVYVRRNLGHLLPLITAPPPPVGPGGGEAFSDVAVASAPPAPAAPAPLQTTSLAALLGKDSDDLLA